ncbi:hypothetical protein HDU79_006662 [Rhizoclosmatium sp. JEL0117]|nr:hypothetical protein HDU79_006662 [Rhizoclosmatium sp. JEL0117]
MQITKIVLTIAALAISAFAAPVATAATGDVTVSQQCLNDVAGLSQVYYGCKVDPLTPLANYTKDNLSCLCTTANQNVFNKVANSCIGPNDSATLAGIKSQQATCQQIKSNAFTSAVPIGVAAAVVAMAL